MSQERIDVSREELEQEARRLAIDALEGVPGALERLQEVEAAISVEKRLREARDERRRQEQFEREAPQREAERKQRAEARAEREALVAGTEDWQETMRLLNAVRGYVFALPSDEREDRRRRFVSVIEEVRRERGVDSRAALLIAASKAPQLSAAHLVEEASPLAGQAGRDDKTALESSAYGMKLVQALRQSAEALKIEVGS
jgi:hypothetical protein